VERKFAVDVVELQDGQPRDLGRFAVTPYTVVHPSGAPPFALRVNVGDRVIAYSGDTEWAEALVEAARGADLFICEAYHFDKHVKYHLDYATLQQARARLQCRRLVLTHMSEDMLARRHEVDAECAQDGATIELGPA
jgi:ribonuclease BN (tRNA processing enzyme)